MRQKAAPDRGEGMWRAEVAESQSFARRNERARTAIGGKRRAAASPIAAVGAVFLATALAGCTSFGFGNDPKPDPNLFTANFKNDLLTYLQLNPANLVGTRDASLAAPALKPFGTESRYVACLRVIGPDWRKEKMVVFFAGEINQYVDATSEQCGGADYQPFPELAAMLSRFGGKK
jgi:hypothetical protein